MFGEIGSEFTDVLIEIAGAINRLATSEDADKLTSGIAILTRKLYVQLKDQGFDSAEAVNIICAFGKGKS